MQGVSAQVRPPVRSRWWPSPLVALGYFLLFVWAVASLLPLYWMFVTALKPPTIVMSMPPQLVPNPFTTVNFQRLLDRAIVVRWFANSCFVSVSVTASTVFLCSLAGYTFAKLTFPGQRVLFWGILSLMMVPGQVLLVPSFILMTKLRWINTYWALIVPDLVSPFGIFLMKQFIQTLPRELMDAGRIDGCSEFEVFWRIMLPLALPGMAVLAIFTFMGQWNRFLWPLIMTSTEDMRVLQVGLATLQFQNYQDYGLLMAGGVVAALPMIVIFLAFQRYFLRGVTIGALKG
ncbi:MAG: carbohydrate ABC transporter permease [Anaerolineae bacterium]|nr:carbohydrate ABC transporter permease [Anaerolineae bacterium]